MYLQIYGMFLKIKMNCENFFVKNVSFSLFNKLYARFFSSFARYFVISHMII